MRAEERHGPPPRLDGGAERAAQSSRPRIRARAQPAAAGAGARPAPALPQEAPEQPNQRGVSLVGKVPFLSRMRTVPVSTTILVLVCAVSLLYGTLGKHDRGMLKASGSPAPIRIPLFGPFPTITDIANGGAVRKEGTKTDQEATVEASAGLVVSVLQYVHRYVMATLLVASSSELAVIVAGFFAYGFDLEKRLLGSGRFAALVVTAVVLRMLWLAIANATFVTAFVSSWGPDRSTVVYREKDLGLRPGPSWLCLLLVVVYEKRRRGRMTMDAGAGSRHAYQPLPTPSPSTETAATVAPAAVAVAAGGSEEGIATAAAAAPAPTPAAAVEPASETESATGSFSSFPFGSSSPGATAAHAVVGEPAEAAVTVKLFGKIPINAGALRAVVAFHLLITMGVFEETVPALMLGLLL